MCLVTVGMRKKKQHLHWVTFSSFHLTHWSYVETVTFLQRAGCLFMFLVPRNFEFPGRRPFFRCLIYFCCTQERNPAYSWFLIRSSEEFLLSFLLIYLPSLLAEWIPWKDYFGEYSYWLVIDKHPQNISDVSFAIPTSLHRCQFMQHDILIFSF